MTVELKLFLLGSGFGLVVGVVVAVLFSRAYIMSIVSGEHARFSERVRTLRRRDQLAAKTEALGASKALRSLHERLGRYGR